LEAAVAAVRQRLLIVARQSLLLVEVAQDTQPEQVIPAAVLVVLAVLAMVPAEQAAVAQQILPVETLPPQRLARAVLAVQPCQALQAPLAKLAVHHQQARQGMALLQQTAQVSTVPGEQPEVHPAVHHQMVEMELATAVLIQAVVEVA
jgi:hypothetical protein